MHICAIYLRTEGNAHFNVFRTMNFFQNSFNAVIDFTAHKLKKNLYVPRFVFISLYCNECVEVWSETKSALKIKGLIIVLTFNHQLVQSEQTGWEDFASQSDGIIESEETALKMLLSSSLELEQRKKSSAFPPEGLAPMILVFIHAGACPAQMPVFKSDNPAPSLPYF